MAIAQVYGVVLAPAASLQVRGGHSQKQRFCPSWVGADLLVILQQIQKDECCAILA